jgi:hypothetical protein
MTDWADNLADMAEAVTNPANFGQVVTKANGDTCTGVWLRFSPRAPDAGQGLTMRLDQQPNPTLRLTDADAADLATGDRLTVDGEDWTITRSPEPDGHGMTTIYLMPAAAETSADQFRRWR